MHLGAMNPQHVFERALISSETSYPWDPFKKNAVLVSFAQYYSIAMGPFIIVLICSFDNLKIINKTE